MFVRGVTRVKSTSDMTLRLIASFILVTLLDPRVSMAQQPRPRRGRGIGAIAGQLAQPPTRVRSCEEARASTGGLSFAPPTRIDFEDVGRVDLTNQYASRGVTFNGPAVLDMSESGGLARSPTHAIQQCYAKEFCREPFDMRFAEPQARVQLWVWYAGRVQMAGPVWLEILDAAGKTIDRCGVTITPENTPQRIALPLELTADGNTIAMARVSAPTLGIVGVAVDDLEFQRIAPRVPDLVIQSVRNSAPGDGPLRILVVVAVKEAPSPATTLTVESPAWGTLSADVRALDPEEEGALIEVPLPANLGAGRYEYVVRVAQPPGVVEPNLDNNERSSTIAVLAGSDQSNVTPDRVIPQPTPDRPNRRPRPSQNSVPWLIAVVLVVVAALAFAIARIRRRPPIPLPKRPVPPRPHRPRDEKPRHKGQPPRSPIDVEPELDAGLQTIAPAHAAPALVLRIRPVMGPSSIHVSPGFRNA